MKPVSDTMPALSVFSKNHTSALISNTRLAILDRYCMVNWVNENFCSLTQYARQELIGRPICGLNLVYLAPEDFNSIHTEISTGKTWTGEVKGLTKHGIDIWVNVTIVPTLDAENEIESYLVLVENITQTKQTLENLKKSEARCRVVVDNQSDIMSLCRVDGSRVFVNQKFCDFTGKSKEEILRTNFLNHPLKGIPKHMYERVLKLCPQKPEISGLFQLENSQNEKVWVSLLFKGVFDHTGNLDEILTIGRDVTELKTAEINKTKYIEELESIAFLTSHKVRAPITELQGFFELLRMHAIHTHEWEKVLDNFKISIKKLDSYTKELSAFVYKSRSSK